MFRMLGIVLDHGIIKREAHSIRLSDETHNHYGGVLRSASHDTYNENAYIFLSPLEIRTNDSNTINSDFIGNDRSKHFVTVMLKRERTADIGLS